MADVRGGSGVPVTTAAMVPATAVVMMALGLGCRSPEPVVEPSAVEPVVVEPVIGEDAERTGAAAQAQPVVEEEPIAAEPEREPQAWVPIELPFSPQALVIRPVRDVPAVVLFPDEGDAIRRGVAKALTARGYELVAVEELERIEAAAARGYLVLEGDQVCRAPLRPEDLIARYFSTRRFVEVEAGCFDGCRLQVSIQDPADPDFYEGFASRRVSRGHDPRAWIAVAGRLREEGGWGGIGMGMTGMSHPPPIRFDFPQGIGPWATPIEEESFVEAEARAASCAHPDPLVGFTYEVRASVDRRGHLSRCLATTEHTMARDVDGACVCEALQALPLPTGPSGRRFRVQAVDDGGFRGSDTTLQLVQAGTEAWIRRLNESPAIDRCLGVVSLPEGLTATVTLGMDPDGAVTEVRIDGDITTQPTMQFASCMVQELRTVALPCRPPGIERLVARLVIPRP